MEYNSLDVVAANGATPATRNLGLRRGALLASLAVERAGLMQQLLGLSEEALTKAPILGSWSIQDILAHIAAWDRWQHGVMRALADGEDPDLSAGEDYHAANDAFVDLWRGQSLATVLDELQSARKDWVAWLANLSQQEFFKERSYEGEDWSFDGEQIRVMWEHDAEHANQIAVWRQSTELRGKSGPQEVLLAVLDATRRELLTCAALVPATERDVRRVCGVWTLKDVLGHVADWEQVGVKGLGDMAAGKAPQVELIDDIEAWNQVHAGMRREQSWNVVWKDLQATRQAFLEAVQNVSQAALARPYPFPWGVEGTPYQWISVFVMHDRDHARDLWPDLTHL